MNRQSFESIISAKELRGRIEAEIKAIQADLEPDREREAMQAAIPRIKQLDEIEVNARAALARPERFRGEHAIAYTVLYEDIPKERAAIFANRHIWTRLGT